MPVSSSVAVIVTLGSTAPVESWTVPVTVAVSTCANPAKDVLSTQSKAAIQIVFFIGVLLDWAGRRSNCRNQQIKTPERAECRPDLRTRRAGDKRPEAPAQIIPFRTRGLAAVPLLFASAERQLSQRPPTLPLFRMLVNSFLFGTEFFHLVAIWATPKAGARSWLWTKTATEAKSTSGVKLADATAEPRFRSTPFSVPDRQ